MATRMLIGHNGGPPIDEPPRPAWSGNFQTWFEWQAACEAVWKKIPAEIAIRRMERAEAIGLTYEEYTIEILERGRHLNAEDADRIAEIKAARRSRRKSTARG